MTQQNVEELLAFRQKEVKLEEGFEDLARKKRSLSKLDEAYQEHFLQGQRAIEDIRESLVSSQKGAFCEELEYTLLQEYRQITQNTRELEEEFKTQERRLYQKQDDLEVEKRRIALKTLKEDSP